MADWPFDGNLSSQDLDLEQEMSVVRSLAETGRKIRVDVNRRQRLPCRSGWIVGGPELSDFHDILEEELNVEDLTTEPDLDRFQRIELAPNHKALGAKCRADLPKVLTELAKAEPETLLSEIGAGSAKLAGYDIGTDDVEVHRVEKDGFAASTFSVDDSGDVSLVLDVSIDDELLSKGLAREITRRVQSKRKDLDLDVEVTIDLTVWLTKGCPKLDSKDWEYVKSETRANPAELSYSKPSVASDKFVVDGETLFFSLKQNN
jgi:isoleucyl-tRNA synthetase